MNAHPATPAAAPGFDDSELGGVLADITSASNTHPGIRLIASGLRTIREDRTITLPDLQLVLADLAGSADASDIVGAIGHLIADLTNPDTNPALAQLPHDVQKETTHQGQLTAFALTDPDLRDTVATACAALDTRDGGDPR